MSRLIKTVVFLTEPQEFVVLNVLEVSSVEVIETLLTLIRESRDNKTSRTYPIVIILRCISIWQATNYISVTV